MDWLTNQWAHQLSNWQWYAIQLAANWQTNWQIEQFANWLADWPTNGPNCCLTDQPADWHPTGWSTDRLSSLQTCQLTSEPMDQSVVLLARQSVGSQSQQTDQLTDNRFLNQPTDWTMNGLISCLKTIDKLTGRPTERLSNLLVSWLTGQPTVV